MTRREFFVGSAAAGFSGTVFADVAAVSSKPPYQEGVPLLGTSLSSLSNLPLTSDTTSSKLSCVIVYLHTEAITRTPRVGDTGYDLLAASIIPKSTSAYLAKS